MISYFFMTAHLVRTETTKTLILFFRYPVSALITIAVMVLVFVALFETAIGIVGGELPSAANVEYTIQKFIVWTTMIMGFSAVSGGIRDETLSGMIETVWMGGVSPVVTLAIRALAGMVITLALNFVLTFVIAVLYQQIGVFSVAFVICIFWVAIASLGVGLLLGAAVVVFKEIGPAMNLLQFLMLPLFMNEARFLGTIPEMIAPGLYALRYLNGNSNPEMAGLFSLSWLLIGLACLSFGIRKSRKDALVYQY